ncbi:hypothetical protein CAPTEDRAFT_191810 [Capitella teleta]|uniref:Apple domain-containing protein n=1 Tax=Capitella teleta TaxID=283909 RepID=R7U6J6_CAPTE|nr:hypothetical protein CAPTEDRAFT_191810 [Capitella teleta]|eukprot:ELT98765.1 hypothetical protein CAPTEDRAFT_191810 [Capitella teleta]
MASLQKMEATLWIALFGTILSWCQSDISVSMFHSGSIPLQSTVNFDPVAEFESVMHSKIQCAGACVRFQGCVAIVMTDGWCKMYDRTASGSDWIAQSQSVYMELKTGSFVTMSTADRTKASPATERLDSTLETQNIESTTRNAEFKTSGLSIETLMPQTEKSTTAQTIESVLETTKAATTAQIMESTPETTESETTAQIMESTPETTEAATTAQIMESTPETTEASTTAQIMESTPETTESETTAQNMESTPETTESETTAQIMESTPESTETSTTAQIMESTPETTEASTTAQIMESTPETTESETTAQNMESTPETTESETTAQIMESTPETTEASTTAQIMESTPETTESETTAQIMESTPETTEASTTAQIMESTPESTETSTTAQIMESTPETTEAATTAQIMESAPETTESETTAQIMESTPETTETLTTPSVKEFPASLGCPSTRSCSPLSADAVFLHYNQSYVVTAGKEYFSYDSMQSMCSAFPYATGLVSELTSTPGISLAPEMMASVMDGLILFIFNNPDVTMYRFVQNQDKYYVKLPRQALTASFPSISVDGGDCFLAHNFTHGTLFDGDKIYVDSLEFKRDEPFHTTYTNVENPFFNFMPSGNPHGCTETFVDGFILFLDHEKIYLYDTASKSHTNLGILCKT